MTTLSTSRAVGSTELRTQFAARLSALYGTEVPAYTSLVDVSHEVNKRVLEREGAGAERLGSIERVTAERHGAIRVGTPSEMAQVARIFGALEMFPCGFYDLRDAHPQPIPVVSTAFRPLDRAELAANPFRVFTSMLVPEDRRFFDEDLEYRLQEFLGRRELFPEALLQLADRATEHGTLSAPDAGRFLDLAIASFALSPEPVDRAWYAKLESISSVAADIGGVSSTHINHLTPRVLDIDDLYASMQAHGVEMIDHVQGPPRWTGRTSCSGRRRSGRSPSHAAFARPTAASVRVRCGCASVRWRRAASRSPRRAGTSTRRWSLRWTHVCARPARARPDRWSPPRSGRSGCLAPSASSVDRTLPTSPTGWPTPAPRSPTPALGRPSSDAICRPSSPPVSC